MEIVLVSDNTTKNNNMVKETRNVGLDLLRITAMCLVTSIHFLNYLGFDNVDSEAAISVRLFISTLRALDLNFINLFVLLSGFLLCNSSFSYMRIIKIWIQVLFVGVLVALIAIIINPSIVCTNGLVHTCFPFLTASYWYIVQYTMLLLLVPFYNRCLQNIDSRRLGKLLIIVGLFVMLYFNLNPFTDINMYIGGARSIVWFSYLYFVGAYISKIHKNGLTKLNRLVYLMGGGNIRCNSLLFFPRS